MVFKLLFLSQLLWLAVVAQPIIINWKPAWEAIELIHQQKNNKEETVKMELQVSRILFDSPKVFLEHLP